MSPAAEFGNVVIRIIQDGRAAGLDSHVILHDIQAAILARPALQEGTGQEETEQLASARASVLAEITAGVANGRSRMPIIEAKLGLLIQVAKRDALIEHAMDRHHNPCGTAT